MSLIFKIQGTGIRLSAQNGTNQTAYGFTGEWTDDTGMSHLRARYYDPSVGTFASLDPFEGYEDVPMSLNGYSYVHGDPVNLTDPSGEVAPIVALLVGKAVDATVGTISGAIVGAIFGELQGRFLYDRMAAGECGCELQKEALATGWQEFFRTFREQGAAFGAAFGGAGGIGGTALMVAGGLAMLAGAYGVVHALQDMMGDDGGLFTNVNPCNLAELILSGFAIVGGAKSVRRGNSQRVQRTRGRQTQTTDTPESHNQQINRDASSTRVKRIDPETGDLILEDGTVIPYENRGFHIGAIGGGGKPSAKGVLKKLGLPTQGKIRFVPPRTWRPNQPLRRGSQNGWLDRFGNEWVKGPSRTKGEPFEWDVQLSAEGMQKIEWLSRDGRHVNVSMKGRVTHR